jgi:hypothetical protein
MEILLLNNNSGLERRFPIANAFMFEDYTDSELLQILVKKMDKANITAKVSSLSSNAVLV